MDDRDRPALTLQVRALIESDLESVDDTFWKVLNDLLTEVVRTPSRKDKPPSKRPETLSLALHSYAQKSFYAEAIKYPHTGPKDKHWLTKLAKRTEKRVMENVAELEGRDESYTLMHHGLTGPQMRRVVAKALRNMIETWPVPDFPLQSADTNTPILPPVKSSPTASKEGYSSLVARQAAAYRAAGVDITSGSPLLMMAAEAGREAKQPIQPDQNTAEKRRAFVEPILREKGWSSLDWANEANVAYHTAMDYLSGARNPYRSTRAKLAKALGRNPNSLPD